MIFDGQKEISAKQNRGQFVIFMNREMMLNENMITIRLHKIKGKISNDFPGRKILNGHCNNYYTKSKHHDIKITKFKNPMLD